MEYLSDRIASANEAQLVAIMYEGLLKKFNDSIENIENDNKLALNESINKSRNLCKIKTKKKISNKKEK